MMRYIARRGKSRAHCELIDSLREPLILLALLLVGGSSSMAAPTSFSWNVNTAGAFNDAANWVQTGPTDLDGVPDANDIVTFRRGSGATYTVTFPGVGTGTTPVDYVTDRLLVGSNTMSFAEAQFNPAPSTYTAENATTAESGRAIIIGVLGGDSAAVLNTRLATFSGAAATIGDAAGSSGTLNVNAGTFSISGSSTTDDELIVGNHGTGALNVNTGAAVTLTGPNGDTVLGKYALSSGTATVSGSGSTWSAGSNLTIGSGGGGALSVAGGGHVASHWGYIGYGAGSSGTATVDGIGAAWVVDLGVHVGEAGIGAMNITAGGHVTSNSGVIGYSAGSGGTASITGSGSSWDAGGELFVGYNGVGALNVTAGGHASNGMGYIGYGAGSSGTVTVDGNSSTWTNSVNLTVGFSGNGVLHITGGGRVDNGDCFLGSGGTGSVSVDGAGSLWNNTGDLSVGGFGTGTLTASNGAAINSAAFTVGGAAEGAVQLTNAQLTTSGIASVGETSVGTVTLAAGSRWELNPSGSSPNFAVGNYGSGTLNVLSASTVRILGQATPELGNQLLSHGTVNVDGAGSEFFVETQDLSVGRFGNGVFNITGSGRVTAPKFIFLGENAASQGDVLVQDMGSIVTALEIDVAHNGTGSLSVEAGGSAAAEVVIVAFGMGSNGMAVVDGTGSYLDVRSGAGQLIVGGGSVGSLSVTGGGLAEAGEVIIGDGISSTGTMTVRGAGSRLTANNEIDVGLSGAGTLTVSDGGVAVAPVILINSQSSVDGNGTLQGDVTNHGIVAPGESPGALHIVGNYAQTAAAKLEIELAGTTPGTQYDQLLITGGATLDGTLDVSLLGGFTPSAGNSFDLLTATSGITGTFAIQQLPLLAGGLVWNLSYGTHDVILSVGGVLGDYNHNGTVDAADYAVWRKGLGTIYTQNDYNVWRAHFGQTAGSGSGAITNAAVPEPATAVMLMLALAGWYLRRRRAA